jgi:hypothetical protein
MSADFPASAADWIGLLDQDCDDPDVSSVLDRHHVSLGKLQWIHGSGRAALTDAGVRLLLWKTGVGRGAAVDVMGVEFVFSGMRAGKPYDGELPHGLLATDSLRAIGKKVQPAMLLATPTPNVHEALWPEYRIQVLVSADETLKSVSLISTRARSRLAG